jgi:hypothetical protein
LNKMGSENAHECTQKTENDFGFDFDYLERYHKDDDEFLNHIVLVPGDETWISVVNVGPNEQSKPRMHRHSPNEPKSLNKCCLPARKRTTTVFW